MNDADAAKRTRLEELERLNRERTPGPWKCDAGNMNIESENARHYGMPIVNLCSLKERFDHCEECGIIPTPPDIPRHYTDDGEFIAEFANSAAALLAIVRAAKAVSDYDNDRPCEVSFPGGELDRALAALESK